MHQYNGSVQDKEKTSHCSCTKGAVAPIAIVISFLIRAQASKAQGPIVFQRIIIFLGPKPVRRRALLISKGLLLLFFFFFFFIQPSGYFWGALTCSKTLENSHTRWNLLASGRHRGWDPGVAQGLYGAP